MNHWRVLDVRMQTLSRHHTEERARSACALVGGAAVAEFGEVTAAVTFPNYVDGRAVLELVEGQS